MRALSTTVAFAGLAAALIATAPAGARTTFSGKVCGLLSAKQVTAIKGVSSRCTGDKPMRGPGSTIYVGNWAGTTVRSPRVQVTVSSYSDHGLLQLAKRNLNQGLPATPKKVTGIGSAAYEATAPNSTGLRFAVGKYVVLVAVNTIGKPSWSTKAVEALAKAIAARL